MAVRFILGRAGSGKTRHCFDSILEALRADPLGAPIYWLLPRQATFTAERELTCASGLGGFCRVRIISFDELGTDLLKECGGAAVPSITQLGRQMILGHLLRKHAPQLKFFDQVAQHPGLAAKLEATLAELDRSGKDPAQIESLAKELATRADAQIDPLHAKLHDLLLIYQAYNAYVGQERLDPRRHMEQVLQCIAASRQLRRATIYVDSFADFDAFERQLLARLGNACQHLRIALTLDPASPLLKSITRQPHELSLFHRTETAYSRLMQAFADEAVPLEPPLILQGTHRFHSPALSQIERNLFAETPGPCDTQAHGIELLEAPDRRAEVEAAARRIRQYLAQGLRLRDIAVLVRQLDHYHDLLNAAFGEHAIPYFVDRRRTMSHHPLLQFLRAVLAIAEHDWPHEAVMLLIKSGLAGLSEHEADALENYVLEHHLRGPVWMRDEPWTWHRTLTHRDDDSPQADQSQPMDELRRRVATGLLPFIQKLRESEAGLPLRQIVVEIFQLFSRFNLRQTLSSWITHARAHRQHEQAGEHEQAWTELVNLFDQMVDLLGQEPVTLAGFREILESGLETFDLAIAPPTVDQVLVGQVDRTRTPDIKAVLLLGLNEGIFPHAPRDGSILTDSERLELQKHQFDVEPGSERRLLDENLLAYVAFTRSSQYLYLSRSTTDDAGRPLGPSPYWRHLRELFPGLKPTLLPHDPRTNAALISTPRQLLTSLMRWVRTQHETQDDEVWPALYHFLATYPTDNDGLDSLRHRVWKALTYDNSAMLTRSIAASLFPRPLRASASQIETFATCPFRHFLRYGLHLQPRQEDDLPTIDLENVFHHILENIVRDMLRQHADWVDLSPQQAHEWVRTYAARIAQDLHGEMMLSNARNRYLLTRIEKTLEQVLISQQAVAQRRAFRTAFGKIRFGLEQDRLPALLVQTPDGNQVHLHGQIDRVDTLTDQAAFAVLDYRLYGDDISLARVYHGLSLQLLSCLLVVQSHSEVLVGQPMTPAAAFYVRLLRQLDKVDHPSDAIDPSDPRFALGGKQRGIFNANYFHALDNTPDCPNSDVVSARLKKDGTFGYKHQTDIAEPDEFAALLDHVRQIIARLADQILAGAIDITPYRMSTTTPCPSCRYRSICRFDPAINRYRHIPPAKRDDVLKRLVEEANHGA